MSAPHVPRLLSRSVKHSLISSYFHPGDSFRSPSHQQGLGARRSSLPNLVPSLPSRCATRRAWTKAGRVPVGSHRPRQPWRARTARYAPCNVVHQAHAQRLSPRMTMESCTHVPVERMPERALYGRSLPLKSRQTRIRSQNTQALGGDSQRPRYIPTTTHVQQYGINRVRHPCTAVRY